MALIKTHLETTNTLRQIFGQSANTLAANRSIGIQLPVDDTVDIYLEYEGMNGSISKLSPCHHISRLGKHIEKRVTHQISTQLRT